MSGGDTVRELRERGASVMPGEARAQGGLGSIIALIAVALILGAGGFFAVTQFMAPKATVAVAGGQAPMTTATLDTRPGGIAAPFTEADAKACKQFAVKARKDEDKADRKAKETNPFMIGSGSMGLAYIGALVTCQAETRPLRFCDPEQKKLLATTVASYDKEVTEVNAWLGGALSAPGLWLAGNRHPGTKIITGIVENSQQRVIDYHAKVVIPMRELARQGLIQESDFAGWLGLSAPLKAFFSDLGPIERVCPQ
jgi:hypothetical protein